MKCPNCERLMSALDRHCRVCHQRLPFWYVLAVVFLAAIIVGLVLLLEI